VGAAKCLYWGEVAAGTPALLLGSASKKVLKMTPAAWQFDGANYTAKLKSYLMELVPPDQSTRLAAVQWITLERNSVAITHVWNCATYHHRHGIIKESCFSSSSMSIGLTPIFSSFWP
jgi:hypothetical protein